MSTQTTLKTAFLYAIILLVLPLALLVTHAAETCTEDDNICSCDELECSDPGACKQEHSGTCGVAVGQIKCKCFQTLPT